jgi:hypothetical protein
MLRINELLLMIIWNFHEHYNYLQITNNLQNLLNIQA